VVIAALAGNYLFKAAPSRLLGVIVEEPDPDLPITRKVAKLKYFPSTPIWKP
jgi:hypothetical protein